MSPQDESAVSPVIGTILLVAITVAIIAIIAAVLMGIGDMNDAKKVGLNAQPATGSNAKLILYGGAALNDLVKLEMIDAGSSIGKYITVWERGNGNEYANVGVPYTAYGVARPLERTENYNTKIAVRGTFSDGTEQVLLTQPISFADASPKDYVVIEFNGLRLLAETGVFFDGEKYQRGIILTVLPGTNVNSVLRIYIEIDSGNGYGNTYNGKIPGTEDAKIGIEETGGMLEIGGQYLFKTYYTSSETPPQEVTVKIMGILQEDGGRNIYGDNNPIYEGNMTLPFKPGN